jgi:hypothetical protein
MNRRFKFVSSQADFNSLFYGGCLLYNWFNLLFLDIEENLENKFITALSFEGETSLLPTLDALTKFAAERFEEGLNPHAQLNNLFKCMCEHFLW